MLSLTPSQIAVVALIARGFMNKQIAHELGVAEATVKAHVIQATRRLGLRNRVELAVWYTIEGRA